MNAYHLQVQHREREKVFDLIDVSDKLEFAWNQKRGVIGHTGVVLICDGKPEFTFDFGPSLAYCGDSGNFLLAVNKSAQTSSAAFQSPVQSGISINRFDESESIIKGSIIAVRTWSKRQKTKAKNAVSGLLSLTMGDYTLLNNNCREFVKKAKEFLTSFWEESEELLDWENDYDIVPRKRHDFDQDMKRVETVDSAKVAGAGVLAALVVGAGALLALGLSKVLEPDSRERNPTSKK